MVYFAKRTMDIVFSLLALVVTFPLILVVVILVRMTSTGPGIFRQTRGGLHGRPFLLLKIRTMAVNADSQRDSLRLQEQDFKPAFKIREDNRVTPIGRHLRRWSVDELPQFLNVLRGEMSLVGPRPHPLDDVRCYQGVEYRRLAVKPGLTGPSQISGRSNLSWEDTVALDLEYTENWTLLQDIQILVRTVKVVISGVGSY